MQQHAANALIQKYTRSLAPIPPHLATWQAPDGTGTSGYDAHGL